MSNTLKLYLRTVAHSSLILFKHSNTGSDQFYVLYRVVWFSSNFAGKFLEMPKLQHDLLNVNLKIYDLEILKMSKMSTRDINIDKLL